MVDMQLNSYNKVFVFYDLLDDVLRCRWLNKMEMHFSRSHRMCLLSCPRQLFLTNFNKFNYGFNAGMSSGALDFIDLSMWLMSMNYSALIIMETDREKQVEIEFRNCDGQEAKRFGRTFFLDFFLFLKRYAYIIGCLENKHWYEIKKTAANMVCI